ncbi:fructose-1,6-bisphosphatase I [Propionicimonas paludicola]|uniref:Fructose-1,6-bisphosphatase class 1 n=1 Tax=Propionicimonas paludicola TaxID=185243 RepID=A0A2A9CVF1_9ACTN|nr:class 1 fructose-bisphosphatase [Propionicimonas paludicola]PFG17632.1 fructose-1,6-bisphosphatase I [Propionicimonas paludicola]
MITLTQYLLGMRETAHATLISGLAVAVKLTAAAASRGPLILDQTRQPSPREVNRSLRRLAGQVLLAQLQEADQLAGISFAGQPQILPGNPEGRYLLLFDAMHGMSNLNDNLPVGSAFSILERPEPGRPCLIEDFLQPGTRQVSAGIALFGPRTICALTTGDGVDGFTLDRDVGNFVLTHPHLRIPDESAMFAIDASQAPHWPAAVRRYVEECTLGSDGPRRQDFHMRWNASAVVGAYRVLNSGGLFLAPDTGRSGHWLAPLLHTAAPLAFLAEQAGGSASTGTGRVLEVSPSGLDARVPLFLGSSDEVARLEGYFADHALGHDREYSHPLFHHRTLFAD